MNSLFCDRRSTAVKAFTRVLGLTFVTIGLLAVTGCGPDNESEGAKANASLGKTTAPDPAGLPKEKIVPPKSNSERKPGATIGQPKDKAAAK
jgi:hypothetical protein